MNFTSRPTRIRPMFVITIIILLVAGSFAIRSRSMPDKKAVALEAVKKSLDAQKEAWNNGKLDTYMDAYASQPNQLVFFTGNTALGSQDEVFTHLHDRYQIRGSEMGTLEFECSIDALESGVVLVWGKWQVKSEGKPDRGLFSRVYKKLPSGWRIIQENTTM